MARALPSGFMGTGVMKEGKMWYSAMLVHVTSYRYGAQCDRANWIAKLLLFLKQVVNEQFHFVRVVTSQWYKRPGKRETVDAWVLLWVIVVLLSTRGNYDAGLLMKISGIWKLCVTPQNLFTCVLIQDHILLQSSDKPPCGTTRCVYFWWMNWNDCASLT